MVIVTERHTPFYVAAGLGLAAFAVAAAFGIDYFVPLGADVFFLVYLVLHVFRLPALTPDYLRDHARADDEPAIVILAVTLGAVAAAVGALFVLINGKNATEPLRLTLALASVPLGWLTIHMMAAFHYAHLYWRPDRSAAGKQGRRRGIAFPGDADPGAYDFLYFSYVIGMTAQTSDVAITDTAMRKVNLLHAIVSFFFNTVLVAAAVNVAVALGH
ncbi:MAG: DUF1345 domain-containing protein [Pararhizobium sp.]